MRVACPHCRQRHDVSHAAVLREAARLREAATRKGRTYAASDGNTTSAADNAARLIALAADRLAEQLDPANLDATADAAEALTVILRTRVEALILLAGEAAARR